MVERKTAARLQDEAEGRVSPEMSNADYEARLAAEIADVSTPTGPIPADTRSPAEIAAGVQAAAVDAPEPLSYGDQVAAEIGAAEETTADMAPPPEPGPSPYEQAMGQAAGLFQRRPSRIVETPAKAILETERAETLGAVGRERAAELKSAAIEAEGMEAVAQIEQDTHDHLRDMQIDEAKNEFERQQYQEQEKRKLDGAIDRYRTGQVRDPWADRSTGQKVTDAIALAFGSLGAAMLGGENVALSMINMALDSEMESQRANMNIAGAAVGMRENALQESMRLSADARIAELHARESMLEAVKYKLRTEAQATGSQQVIANAEKVVARMDQQIAGLKSQQDLRIQEMGFAKVGGGYAVPKELRKLGLDILKKGVEEGITTEGKIQLEQAKQMSAGERGGLKPNEFANQLTKYGDRIKDADDAKGTVRRFLDKYGEGDIPGYKAAWFDPRTEFSELSEEARHVNQEVGSMIASYVKSISGGQVTPEEYERLKSNVIGAGTINDLRAGLKLMEAKIDRQIDVVNQSTKPEIVDAYRGSPVRPERPGSASLATKYGIEG